MKRISIFFCAACMMLYAGAMSAQVNVHNMSAQFAKNHGAMQMQQLVAASATSLETNIIGPVNSYGFMQGPNGATWTYTASYAYENNHIKGVAIDVYDETNKIVGKLSEEFELEETDLWVNSVSISPVVTKKFFNFDNNLEVMLFVYVATKNYQGRYFNNVYSINPTESSLVCTLQGNLVLSENLSTNPQNDNFVMAFFRDGMVRDTVAGTAKYCYSYDIYEKAGYGTNGPKLVKTFDIPYDNIKALNDPMPVLMVPNEGKMNYFVAQYEKPYFVPETYDQPEPEVTANNKFVITHYDNKFNVVNETKIAMEKDADSRFLYTFYYIGSLDGKKDVIMDYAGTGKPAYVVTQDNYETSSDASVMTYCIYNVDGEKVNTVVEHSLGTIYMSDVVGHERQYAFMLNEDDNEVMRFVDVPSCETVTELSLYNGGDLLSNNVDRVAKGDSYEYVMTLLQGNGQEDGSTVQRVAWFNTDGDLQRYDHLNMGMDVEYAQVFIYAPVLNPRLFHTDDAYEYLVLVKRNQENTTVKEEVLMVCNNKGEILLEQGADEEKGGILSMIDVLNIETCPTLLCTYSSGSDFTLHYTSLPLAKTEMKGKGTEADPYQITCVSDFMQIDDKPSACYKVMNDIDFGLTPFVSLENAFTGKLDGDNHVLKNMVLENGGIFLTAYDTMEIKNMVIEDAVMILTGTNASAGFVVNNARGGIAVGGSISNVHLVDAVIEAADYRYIVGGIVGEASLYMEISGCSVKDGDIYAPKAEVVGGIAGKLATSSYVHASAFEGEITAGDVVGGIVGEISSGENIYDCHVDAAIDGKKTIGGIVGKSGRGPIARCYAEGILSLDASASEGEVGGIAGYLGGDAAGTDETMRIENCLVNIEAINLPENTENIIAHRIVGFTYVDDFVYDWNNVDYSKPQEEWPRIYGTTEKCIKDNYVVSDLAVVDSNIAAEHNTTEGANLDSLSKEWLEGKGYAFGTALESPWTISTVDGGLKLWYEDGMSTSVEDTEFSEGAIKVDGELLKGDGLIEVYTINGMCVKAGKGMVNTNGLQSGVYIIRLVNGTEAKTMKCLVR